MRQAMFERRRYGSSGCVRPLAARDSSPASLRRAGDGSRQPTSTPGPETIHLDRAIPRVASDGGVHVVPRPERDDEFRENDESGGNDGESPGDDRLT